MKPLRFLLTLGLLLSPALAEDPPAHDRVTVDVKHGCWRASSFSPSGVAAATDIGMDLSGDVPVFTSYASGKRATFSKPILLNVDMELFPTMKLKYSGSNVDTKNTFTCIWIGLTHQTTGAPQIQGDERI